MCLLDPVDLLRGELGDASQAHRGGNDRCSRGSNAVLSEGGIVRSRIPSQMIKKVLAYGYRKLMTGEFLAVEGEDLTRVQGLEVHKFVGHLVVVLQRVNQGCRFNSMLPGQVECQAYELGVAGGEGMVI